MRQRSEQPPAILILRLLEKHDLSAYQIAEKLGLNVRNTREYMKILRGYHQVHVSAWESHGRGPFVPVWGLGDYIDAERPALSTWRDRRTDTKSRKRWVDINLALTNPKG
jgi:hypothetical protein